MVGTLLFEPGFYFLELSNGFFDGSNLGCLMKLVIQSQTVDQFLFAQISAKTFVIMAKCGVFFVKNSHSNQLKSGLFHWWIFFDLSGYFFLRCLGIIGYPAYFVVNHCRMLKSIGHVIHFYMNY
ncbi:hypothetical protein BpHYR1_026130 [Brachionus plicatilis]|uniref:Uncharacterized protein n=1 Tax=Brachionus plicatilis TaxID=10195 RepID=A0A3M7T764_BRAPC|nr:hypothetical protein BpHYR1_026130 [Brachionus plicatilis]